MLVELNYKKEGRKRGEKGKRKKGEQEDGGKERETDQSVTAPGLVLCVFVSLLPYSQSYYLLLGQL
jgi:hypothetical protein